MARVERLGNPVLVGLAVVALVVLAGCYHLLSGSLSRATPAVAAPVTIAPLPPSPTATHTGPAAATSRAPAPTVILPTTPTATPTVAPANAYVVANTGVLGVNLRAAPATGERIRSWAEGTLMVEIGEEARADGRAWKRVRDPAGNLGWVAADFLAPAPVGNGPLATVTPTGPRPEGSALPEMLPTPTSTPTPSPEPASVRATYDVELLASDGHRQDGYVVVEGRVRNARGRDLRFVWAVVDLYDANKQLVKSHSVPIKQDPFPAGQTSPFKMMAIDNPQIAYFVIGFKEIRGAYLVVLDSHSR